MKKQIVFALPLLLMIAFPKWLFAAENYDLQKLAELERQQNVLLEARAPKKTKETESQPSQKGIQVVTTEQLKKPPEVVREEFRIVGRKKNLLERMSILLNSSISYDTNVFRTREARSDFFYRSGGSLSVDLTNLYKELGFDMTYRGNWTQYFSFSRLNRFDQSINFDIPGAGKRLRIGKKITVAASVGASLGSLSRGSTQEQGVFSKLLQPYLTVNADYLISKKFSTDFTYNLNIRKTGSTAQTSEGETALNPEEGTTESDSGREITTVDHSFFHRLRYHVTPKTFTFVGVGYGFTTESGGDGDGDTGSDGSNDGGDSLGSSFQRLSAGIEGKLTSKSVINLEVGAQRRAFKAEGSTTDYSLYVQGAYLVQLTRKWSARAIVLRDTQASFQENSGYFTTTAVNLGVTYKPTQKWQLNFDPFFRWNQSNTGDTAQTTASTGTTGGTTPAPETTSSSTENSYIFGFDSGIRYYIKRWVSVYVAYRLERRYADMPSSEYLAKLATFGVDIGPLSTWKGR